MKCVTFKRDSVLSRSILASAPYITGLLSFLMVGLSGLRAVSRNYVSTINGVFSIFSLPQLLSIPVGVIVGFRNFLCGLKCQKKNFAHLRQKNSSSVDQGLSGGGLCAVW